MSDIALRFIIANLAASAAILLVLALRKPVRLAFGARVAYALWLLAPLAALGSLLPPRVIEIMRPAIAIAEPAAPSQAPEAALPAPAAALAPARTPISTVPETTPPSSPAPISTLDFAPSPDPWAIGALVWLIGVIATALWLARNQSRFLADARAGFAGPAVAGFLNPRIITPSDFEQRFDLSEREVIFAHEIIHLTRNDARINAAVALARCLAWFNPLVHLGAHVMRIDQELACDAMVVARHPKARAIYASALLKAQLAARPLPLGCYWPAGGEHPLTERIEMLKRTAPGRVRRLAGAGAVVLLAAAAGAAAWAAKPPETRLVEQTPAPTPAAPRAVQPDQTLRIVAVKPGLLEVRSAKGDKYVHRHYEPGESYTPSTGRGWTITVDDGSAFEWRRGDESLGLVQAEGGPVNAQSVDQALGRPPAIAPQPVRYEPQQAPAIQQPQLPPRFRGVVIPPEYDPDGAVTVRGTVERIDFTDTKYTVFVRASSLFTSYPLGTRADTSLFELSPTPYWGDRDAVNKDLKDKAIMVTGLRAVSRECQPACKLMTQGPVSSPIKMVRPTALPAITTTPGFGAVDVVMRYDSSSAPAMVQGVVQRMEFGQSAFDAYVQAPTVAGVPGQLFQVRSEYRLPRADIEKQLIGKTVYVAGWRSKAPADVACGSPCGIYATDIRLASGEIVRPAGQKLINPAQPDHPFAPGDCFKTEATSASSDLACVEENSGVPSVDIGVFQKDNRYDMNAPVTIDGHIIRADHEGWLVEVIGFEPANTPGAMAGAQWFIESRVFDRGGPAASASMRAPDVGRRVTTRGYNARDTSCTPTCRMISGGSIWLR